MNILIEGGDLNPPFKEGTKNIVYSFSQELNKKHNVIILTKIKSLTTNNKNKLKRFEIINGIKYYRWGNYVDLFFLYKKLIKKEKIDLIHIFAKGLRPIPYLKLLKSSEKPIIFSLLGYPEFYSKEKMKNILNEIDLLAFSSNYLLKSLGIESKKVRYIPFGIDLGIFKKTIGKNDKNKNKTIKIAFLRNKNLPCFLEVIKKINSENKNVSFILNEEDYVGYKKISEFIEKKGITNFEFKKINESMANVLSRADILVEIDPKTKYLDSASPPVLILEAMGCETKIVAPNIPEISEIITDSKTGFLFDINNFDSIVNSIKKAIKSTKNIGKNARNFVLKNYDLGKITKNYEEIYSNLIKNQDYF